jgi:hypothetical protein
MILWRRERRLSMWSWHPWLLLPRLPRSPLMPHGPPLLQNQQLLPLPLQLLL